MPIKASIFFKKFVLLIGIFLISSLAEAQKEKDPNPQRDTLAIYKKLKKFSYKHKTTKLIFHAIFVDPAPRKYEKKPLSQEQHKQDPNLKYKGKIIRSIEVQVFDPFGYSVNDTLNYTPVNSVQELGNRLHVTTRKRIIRNLLLFKAGDQVDEIKISESERLIRAIGYANDARIYITKANLPPNDSVDIKVVVQDRWAIDMPIKAGLTGGRITLRDKNIVGSGQRFEQVVLLKTSGEYLLAGSHTVTNISDTYISSIVNYSKNNDATRAGFSFDRPFFSALAKWAGGVAFNQTWASYKYSDPIENIEKSLDLTYHSNDLWLARNFKVKSGSSVNSRLSNVVLAVRYAKTNFEQRPSFDIDSNRFNLNTTLYLGSIGFSLSKFYKDQFIFRFGANEDIPEGTIAQVLYGVSYMEQNDVRIYAGADISKGIHFNNVGYFSVNASYGSYFNQTQNSSTLNLGFTYFTDLMRSQRWYFRQFIYGKYVSGFNKLPHERITLRSDELYGFNSGSLTGVSKLLLNLESVIYTPYNFLGFRFAPLLLAGFGTIKNNGAKLFSGPIYQSYAVGVLFRNENLLTPSFQLTFGFYPNPPDANLKNNKFNPVTGISVKFRSFGISKPSVVGFE